MHAMPIMIGVLCCLAIAYRFYSAFLAAKVAALDDRRQTPAHEFNDGQNYHPTHKWVLFGHHFAAISGAGPLIGPVLAIQFGYLPGLLWIVIGVCLAGAVQDMLVLAASVRRGGRSLAEIARAEIGTVAGVTASLTILFVVIIALSGLGVVVVKALGGEDVKLAAGTIFEAPAGSQFELPTGPAAALTEIPAGTRILYRNGAEVVRSEAFTIVLPAKTAGQPAGKEAAPAKPLVDDQGRLVLPAGTRSKSPAVPGARLRSPVRFLSLCSSGCTCTNCARGAWSRLRPSARLRCSPRR